MFNSHIRIKQFLLLIGDFIVFQAAVPIMLLLRYGSVDQERYNQHALPFLFISSIWIVGYYVAGLYDLKLTRDRMGFYRTYFEGVIANLLLSLAFFYTLPIFGIAPRTNLILYVVIVLLLDYIWRLVFNRFISRNVLRTRMMLVGSPEEAKAVEDLLKDAGLGFELVAVMQTAPGTRYDDGSLSWYVSPSAIKEAIERQGIDTIIISHKPEEVQGLQDALYQTLFSSINLMDRTDFEEMATGRLPLEKISQSWFLSHLRESEKTWYESLKRILDVILCIPTGIVTLILFPFISLLVKLSGPGSILIRQERIGKGGKPFLLYKFRTMVQNAELPGQPQYALHQKNDPRVTSIGRILRSTGLDELPQVWNILRGDMSLIGPRPERPQFVEELTKQMPFYALRHLTRPGLTGWAQVRFPYASTFEDNLKKLQYDLYYIKHRSLVFDAMILLKTIRIVLSRMMA